MAGTAHATRNLCFGNRAIMPLNYTIWNLHGLRNYIHDNPVWAGFVRKQEDWVYSSISNYMEMESKIPEVIPVAPFLNFNG